MAEDLPAPPRGAWIRVTASGGKPENDWRRALIRMYRLWGELAGREVEVIDFVASNGPACLLRIAGADVWPLVRWEDGIHRVERVLSLPGREKLDWVHAFVDTWPDFPALTYTAVRGFGFRGIYAYLSHMWPEAETLRVFSGLAWKMGPIVPPSPSPSDGPYIRTYALHPTPGVFDERCEWATRDVQQVLDGGLDELLAALGDAMSRRAAP